MKYSARGIGTILLDASREVDGACTCGILKCYPPQGLPWHFPGSPPRSHPTATCFSHRDPWFCQSPRSARARSMQDGNQWQELLSVFLRLVQGSPSADSNLFPCSFSSMASKSLYLPLCLTGIKMLQSNITETEALEQCWNLLQAKGLNKTKQKNWSTWLRLILCKVRLRTQLTSNFMEVSEVMDFSMAGRLREVTQMACLEQPITHLLCEPDQGSNPLHASLLSSVQWW